MAVATDLHLGASAAFAAAAATAAASGQRRRVAVLLVDAMELTQFRGAIQILDDLEAETHNMAEVLEAANRLHVPVVELTYGNAPPTNPAHTPLRADNWSPLHKPHWSAFEDTDLHQRLQGLGVTDLVVLGFNQIACVKETVRSARQLGYEVYTAWDVIQGGAEPGLEQFYQQSTHLMPSHDELPVLQSWLGVDGWFDEPPAGP